MGLMERLERAKMAKVASEKDVSLEELEYYDEYEMRIRDRPLPFQRQNTKGALSIRCGIR